MPPQRFEEQLLALRPELLGFLRRHAPHGVLRYESPEDLLQGMLARALEASEKLEQRDDDATRAWLFRLARNFLTDRTRYWLSLIHI